MEPRSSVSPKHRYRQERPKNIARFPKKIITFLCEAKKQRSAVLKKKNPQKVRKKKLVSLVNRRDYCVVTLSLSRRNSQGKFKYSQHFVPLACRLCSGLSVLASVALKCLPGGRRLKQGGGSFTMLWTPENFFCCCCPANDPLSHESQDALYGAAICAVLVPECSWGKCSHRCAS